MGKSEMRKQHYYRKLRRKHKNWKAHITREDDQIVDFSSEGSLSRETYKRRKIHTRDLLSKHREDLG